METSRLALLLVLLAPLLGAAAQPEPVPEPDLGPVSRPVDELAGEVLPPALGAVYDATGQRVDREDIRLALDLQFEKGEVDLLGFLLGSGRTEVEAHLDAALEFRVVSSDRVRALASGENAYNMSAENATFLRSAYLPADVLRASFTPELLTIFKERQEEAMETYVRRSLPELELRDLRFAWENTTPRQAFQDSDLADPPITARLEVTVRYLRTDSLDALLRNYLDPDRERGDDGKKRYIRELKQNAGDPLQTRDFFSVAAYSQLLNLSAQPGWAIDVDLSVPRGYAFTYFNDDVLAKEERRAALRLDALDRDDEDHKVFLASITHKRAVAAALFGTLWAATLLAAPVGILYQRRLDRM